MYSLLVSSITPEEGYSVFSVDRGRFLEYTDDGIVTQLATLSDQAIEAICSWPCIVMQEGRGDEEAHVVQIAEVVAKSREIALTLVALPDIPVLTNDTLWKLRRELDIADFEFSRMHWTIKDKMIWPALGSVGIVADQQAISCFANQPLPAPSRSELLRAGKLIGDWGHTDIDELILEAGVDTFSADRALGSRRDRANALIRFALDNPGVTTAENSLLSAFILRRAARVDTADADALKSTAEVPPQVARLENVVKTQNASRRTPNTVFVVHGLNDQAQNEVVAFLGSVGLRGIVLHEQPNMGRHLLTKFIEEAELVTFAIVLMTDDDMGSRKGGTAAPRARQNVILELGYFLSHLGQSRVCALITPGLETPSDFDGIVYIKMSNDGGWKGELKRELAAAEMPVTSGGQVG